MKQLFDLNNPVMRFIIKLFDCMLLSVLWAVFSLPVFTMGAASTALYSAVYHHIRREEDYLWHSFYSAFRENIKRSTLAWLPMLLMFLFLIYDVLALRALIRAGHPLGRLFGVIVALLCVAAVWAAFLAAYCARFQGGVKDMLRFSFYLLMAHPLRSLGVMALVLGAVAMVLVVPGLAAMLPAAACWAYSPLIEQTFLAHMQPEDQQKTKDEEDQP